MQKGIRHSGFWWLPPDSDKRLAGRLEYDADEGLVLELYGSFHPRSDSRLRKYPIIQGYTDSDKRITLQNCWPRRRRGLHAELGTTELAVGMALVGYHFDSVKDIRFSRVLIRYAHLDEWMSESGLSVGHGEFVTSQENWHARRVWLSEDPSTDYGGTTPSQFIDRYWSVVRNEHLVPITVPFEDREVVFRIVNHTNEKPLQVTTGQQAWVEVRWTEERLLSDSWPIANHVRDFLTIAIGSPTYPIEIKGLVIPVGNSGFRQVAILRPEDLSVAAKGAARPREMLFELSTVRDEFQHLLATWCEKADALKPVYDLYFSTQYNPHMYVHSAFLSLTQALETYHRRTFGGVYQSDAEYRTKLYQMLVQAIPADLDQGFKESLRKGTLKYANQYSLRKRLKEITDRIAEEVTLDFLASKKARGTFVGRVCEIRNYLTHYDPDEEREVEPSELGNLYRQLEQILRICLLEEMGLSFARIKEMLKSRRT